MHPSKEGCAVSQKVMAIKGNVIARAAGSQPFEYRCRRPVTTCKREEADYGYSICSLYFEGPLMGYSH